MYDDPQPKLDFQKTIGIDPIHYFPTQNDFHHVKVGDQKNTLYYKATKNDPCH
jgi:hypothetical protein